jgi:hypothetical protein
MKTRAGLHQNARVGLMRGHANATLRYPYSSQLSPGALLRRIVNRLVQFFTFKPNDYPGFDTSFGEHVNLPKEFLENLDQERSASRIK